MIKNNYKYWFTEQVVNYFKRNNLQLININISIIKKITGLEDGILLDMSLDKIREELNIKNIT